MAHGVYYAYIILPYVTVNSTLISLYDYDITLRFWVHVYHVKLLYRNYV